jgi:hypothetical protein
VVESVRGIKSLQNVLTPSLVNYEILKFGVLLATDDSGSSSCNSRYVQKINTF